MIRKNGNFKDMKISHWQLHSLEFLFWFFRFVAIKRKSSSLKMENLTNSNVFEFGEKLLKYFLFEMNLRTRDSAH